MRGPGQSRVGGSRGSLVQEQIESRLARSGVAVIGEMMRGMASNPGLRQLLFGGLGDEAMGGGRSRSDSPHAPYGWRSEGFRAMELAAEGRLHHERREPRGSERQRDGGGGRQDGRGDGRGDRPYRHLPHGSGGGSPGQRDALARRGGATASGTSGGEYTGDSARRSRTRGRGAHGGLGSPGSRESSRERFRSASDRDRQYAVRNFPCRGSGRGGARRGHSGLPGGAAPDDDRRAPARAGERDDGRPRHGHGPPRSRGAPCGDGGGAAPGALRRQPADTRVSQKQRDAARDGDCAPADGLALATAEGDRDGPQRLTADGRAADWEGPPSHWDGQLFCGHDARIPHTSTCAACFLWHEFRNTRLPCGHQPTDTYPICCDVCRFYFDGLDERRGRPRRLACGQPAACPILWGSCSHCLRAGHTHGTFDLLFCGHTLERPGRDCLSCEARRGLHDAEGGVHVINTRHFPGGATAGNCA